MTDGAEGGNVWSIVLAGGDGVRTKAFIRRWLGYEKPKQYCTFVGSTEQVEKVAESYTGITLNVADAKAHLETAKAALTEGHFDVASKDLATIQEEVTVVYAGERGPLAHAREDLALTQIYMDQGLRKQAQLALTDASASLSRYEKSTGTHQADVKTLQEEIAALSKELDQSTEGPLEKVKTKLMGWWDRVKSWESRHFSGTESPTTGLS